MFESNSELETLQRLLDNSFERSGKGKLAGFSPDQRLSAPQLAGFRGIRLVSIASVNSKQEPRVAPRSAAFLHGKFYLAANSDSISVRRLRANPSTAITYYENHVLIMGHGKVTFLSIDDSASASVSKEWKEAFRGGRDALRGVDLFVVVEATHLVAFANLPRRYPAAWDRTS